MKTPVSFKVLSTITLVLLVNLAGGILIYQTYLLAQKTDQAAIAYGHNIAQSIAVRSDKALFEEAPKQLGQLAQDMLTIENIEGVMLIDSVQTEIAQSGQPIPKSLIDRFTSTETLGIRQQNLLYVSAPVTRRDYSTKDLTANHPPNGYVILALSETEGVQRKQLLTVYGVAGIFFLLLINLMIIKWRHTPKRGMASSTHSAFKEMASKREHRQLEHSMGLQKKAIDKAREEALKASEIKSQFIANMSHEIRTPLNAIIGFTDLLLKTSLDHKQKDFLSTIRKSSVGLLQIINDILDFSKIEAGKIALDKISINLRDTIDDVLTVLAPSAHEKRIELVGMVHPEVPSLILADPLRLKQILTNLVSNGIKFTQHGNVVVRATLDKKQENQSIIKISVSDTGIGIAEKKQKILFNAFSQADTSTTRQFGGTGLGLVIAKQLVEQMNGQIGVISLPRQGANFWFTFETKPADSSKQKQTVKSISQGHIVLYDGHPVSRLATVRCLRDWKITSHSSTSLQEMAKYVASCHSSNPVDLAIISLGFKNSEWSAADEIITQLKTEFDCTTILQHNTVNDDEHEACINRLPCIKLAKPVRQHELHVEIGKILTKPAEFAATAQQDKVNTSRFIGRQPMVLAVDDNSANLKLVQELLTDLGARVYTAISGQHALNMLKVEPFDIIYMDIQMPGMDGVETTRRIRNTPSAYRDVPIVALTAHALESEKEHLLASGLDDYLSKPVTGEQLLDTILKWTDVEVTSGEQISTALNNADKPKETSQSSDQEIFDTEMAIRLAAGKKELAKELFDMLLRSLEREQASIVEAYKNNNHDQLLQNVHRLHGATRYCGVPALQSATACVESTLKQSPAEDLNEAMKNLNYEIQRLNNWASNETSVF